RWGHREPASRQYPRRPEIPGPHSPRIRLADHPQEVRAPRLEIPGRRGHHHAVHPQRPQIQQERPCPAPKSWAEGGIMSAPGALIRNAIFVLGAAVVRRPVIRAATALRHAASAAAADCARYAREDGKTWEQIGEALGFKPGPDLPPVIESAFRVLASHLGSGPSFAWTCPACGQTVIDHGPEAGPHDSEQGHGDGCEQFVATIEAWDRQWEDDSE